MGDCGFRGVETFPRVKNVKNRPNLASERGIVDFFGQGIFVDCFVVLLFCVSHTVPFLQYRKQMYRQVMRRELSEAIYPS